MDSDCLMNPNRSTPGKSVQIFWTLHLRAPQASKCSFQKDTRLGGSQSKAFSLSLRHTYSPQLSIRGKSDCLLGCHSAISLTYQVDEKRCFNHHLLQLLYFDFSLKLWQNVLLLWWALMDVCDCQLHIIWRCCCIMFLIEPRSRCLAQTNLDPLAWS